MKKIVSLLVVSALSLIGFTQMQIDNSDFEQWENVTGGTEPVNWNSFITASGAFANFAAVQIEASNDIRPGSSGTKSVKIWSHSILGITANGNVTLGRINMGATQASHPDNYNKTIRSNSDFHQVLTDYPDSLVFWAKFTPNGHNENARMIGVIHDDFDYRDPEDAESPQHVVAVTEYNFPSTNGEWVRMSVPFVYSGPATEARYFLLTFATNESPGGGAANDQLWIDDVELIYNPSSVAKNVLETVSIYPNPAQDKITIQNLTMDSNYSISSVLGQKMKHGIVSSNNNHIDISELNKGVYFLQLVKDKNTKVVRFIKD